MTRRRLHVHGYEVYKSRRDGHVEVSLLGPTGETLQNARWTMSAKQADGFGHGGDVSVDGTVLESSHALHSITACREVTEDFEIREQFVMDREDLLALLNEVQLAAQPEEKAK